LNSGLLLNGVIKFLGTRHDGILNQARKSLKLYPAAERTAFAAATAAKAPCLGSRRQVNNGLGDMLRLHATRLMLAPNSCLYATVSRFTATDPHRRRFGPRTSSLP
jgi:hypothetical protein